MGRIKITFAGYKRALRQIANEREKSKKADNHAMDHKNDAVERRESDFHTPKVQRSKPTFERRVRAL